MEFLKVDSIDTAREKLFASANGWMAAQEIVPLAEALERILAEDIVVCEHVPTFRRSTVDGYAVCAADTAAAGEGIPVFLTVKGQVEMGQPAAFVLTSGICAEVATGGMLPDGADAVMMVEYAEPFGADGIALYTSVSHGEHVVQIGEDVKAGELLLPRGKCIQAQDIGAMAAAGIVRVPVYRRPRLSVLSTGDELIAPEQSPTLGQIRDVNTNALTALAQKIGFEIVHTALVADDAERLEQAIRAAMEKGDIVAVSGGSSRGKKDVTRIVFDRVASPGVYTHGLAVRPGKPTILGHDAQSETLLIGLPGHPVAAMMMFELLLGWLWRSLTGSSPHPAIPAQLACNVAAAPGKLNCWPAKLMWTGDSYLAEPIFGKSGLITVLTKADGYFTLNRESEGLTAGQRVLIHLF
ncbi:MAG: molybdopterin-binding protein [Oscillospiraceae bacterium]|nr:molybdopterin-binding protein [Oscillospiraceae bacterium]